MTDGAQTSGLVSIVIPCYGGDRYLSEAIESCLGQSYRNIEVIVVDDASPDSCIQIARRYAGLDGRVRVICRETNGGVAIAFNTGFQQACGDLFTRLAQDDVLHRDAIKQMVQIFQAERAIGMVYADCEVMNEVGAVLYLGERPSELDAFSWGNGPGLCVMWRRCVWDSVGEFDSTYDAAEDFDYWVRVAERYSLRKVVGPPLLKIRQHAAMGSLVHMKRQEHATRLVCRRLSQLPHLFGPHFWWKYIRMRSYQYCSFVADYSGIGEHWAALYRLLLSFLLWPIPYSALHGRKRDARFKLLVVTGLRLLRLYRST